MATTTLTVKPKSQPSDELRDLSISLANNQQQSGDQFGFNTSPTKTVNTTKVNPEYGQYLNPGASDSYTVKQGDTLGAIAKQLGVGVGDIGGYRSGDANLIFPGEKLTVNRPQSTPSSQGEYNALVKNELGAETESETVPGGKYQADLENARLKREESFKSLENLTTATFDREYKDRGLEKSKAEMSNLDNEIARLKAERDEAVNKVRTNPGLSAAQMAGDIKKMSDFQNEKINTVIMQRNSLAESYNQELQNIDRIVENAARDAQLQYGYWDKLYNEARSMSEQYDKMLREEFMSDRDQDNFEKQLAQQLQIAGMKGTGGGGSVNLQLVRDPVTNDPLYWFNPQTSDITYVDQPEGTRTGGATSFEDLSMTEQKEDSGKKWYNPFSWFR